MKFWRTRKKSTYSPGKSLSMEQLEDRAMMATLSLVSGQVTSFYDADGSQVSVKLAGPGQGTIELVGGVLTGAAIDSLELTGTTGTSKLKVSTRGGSVKGTTINDLAIEKALNESSALKHFKAKKLYFNDGGSFTADGDVAKIRVRALGDDVTFNVDGDVAKFKAQSLGEDTSFEVAGTLQRFVAQLLEAGSAISAEQLDMLKIKQQATGASVEVGDGGLARTKVQNFYNSSIAAQGDLGKLVFRGDVMGSTFTSNIDKGSDGIFGTIDDFVVDPTMPGHINTIKFGGDLGAKGTNQEVRIVTSGNVGEVKLGRAAQESGGSPKMWEQAAQSVMPLSIIQQSANATGYSDDNIWIAVFGTDLNTNRNYYLSPDHVNHGVPALQQTAFKPLSTTPNLPLVNSYTLTQWKNANQSWGSNLAFPVPAQDDQWSGRILISVGAPVQAQINANGTIASPSASDPIDPSTGTFYDFLEFTISGPSIVKGTHYPANLDIDTSLVDAFGLPMALQLFEQNPSVTAFTGTLTAGSNSITAVADTSKLATGQSVVGENIPLGATIVSKTSNSVTLSMNAGPGASGAQSLKAVAWGSYDVQIQGTIGPNSNVITGVNSNALNNLILNSNVGTSQPISAANVLPDATTIESYVIGTAGGNDSTITLTKNSLNSVTSGNFTFTIDPAGPVGVSALRNAIMGTGDYSLLKFLQQKIDSGNLQALPFRQTAYPYLLSGPAPIFGVVPSLGAIEVETAGTGVLSQGDLVRISGVLGNTVANGLYAIDSTTATTFTIDYPISNGDYTGGGTVSVVAPALVTAATNSGEITITTQTAISGLADNDMVVVSGVAGNTAANGTFTVKNVSGSTFTLEGTQGNGGYTFGGIAYKVPASSQSITNVTDSGTGQMTVTADTTGMSSSSIILIQGVQDNTAANGLFLVDDVMSGDFKIGAPVGNGNYNENAWSMAITGAETQPAYVSVSNPAGLSAGNTITIQNVQGNTSVNGSFVVTAVDSNLVTLGAPVGNLDYTSGGYWSLPGASESIVSGSSTSGQPVVITTGNTLGLANGDSVRITGANGNSAINGVFAVSNVTSTTFTIASVNGNGTAITVGSWQLAEAITDVTDQSVPIVITTSNTDAINVGGVVSIFGVGGNTNANGMFVVTNKTSSTITLGSPAGSGAYVDSTGTWTGSVSGSGSVTDAINGGLVEIHTSNTSGLNEDDVIQITGVGGNTGANGVYTVIYVGPDRFGLANTLGTGTYTRGGTWKEFGAIPRLVSPKDLVETLSSPQDEGDLNNYFNELIDDFFLKYLPSDKSINSQAGGGQTLQVTSTASGSQVTYNGVVTNVGTANGGYVLRFTPSGSGPGPTSYNPNTLDIYYPFFTTNAPSTDVYAPLFGTEEPPAWIVNLGKQNESATQMLFASDAVFADNTARANLGMSATAAKVVADLENLVSGAFNRGIALNPGNTWSDSSTWFPENGVYNYWVEYWHQSGLTYGDLAYAFAYDDKFGASTNLQIANVGLTQITLGSWSNTATSSTTSVTSSATAAVAQNASVTFTATVSGAPSTGTVSFFVNGIPINENNDSNSAPLQPRPVTSGVASITADLPSLPNGNHTYTVTAVYSGDGTFLPSIGTTTVEISA